MKQMITSRKLTITIAMSLTIFGWFLSSVSLAKDTLSLKQLLLSIQTSSQSDNLTKEISNVLRSSKNNAEQIQCAGTKLGGRYSSIPIAAAPFKCNFSNNLTITINAQNFVILPSGRATPLENAKNFHLMPKPISLSYKITSWNWTKAPTSKIQAVVYIAHVYLSNQHSYNICKNNYEYQNQM